MTATPNLPTLATNLPPHVATRTQLDAAIEARKEVATAMRAWRATQWGKDLDESVLRALGTWARRHGLDITEVEVLGGKPYINASYYLRQLTQLDPEALEYARADHVHADPRLLAAMDEPIPADADAETVAAIRSHRAAARREHYRRMMERCDHNLPDSAQAAVVYRVKLRDTAGEFVGADWCGGKKRDPVGDQEPAKTAETRAARRCLRQVVSAFPTLRSQVEMIDGEAKQLATTIEQSAIANRPEPRGIARLGESTAESEEHTDATPAEVMTTTHPPFAPLATPEQRRVLVSLAEAIEISDEEREQIAEYLEDEGLTFGALGHRIDELHEIVRERRESAQ